MSRRALFSVEKTEIIIHASVLFYAIYAILVGHGLFLFIAFTSILLHESAHAILSALLGQPPSSIEITPLGAVMRLEDDAKLPIFRRLVVVLAGPVATLLICISTPKLVLADALSEEIGRLLFMSNLSILIINLLPALPLDGGRIISMLASMFFRPQTVGQIMKIMSTVVGVGLILLNILVSWRIGGWNLSLAIAGCCILYSLSVATTSKAMAELRSCMDRKIRLERRGCIQTSVFTVLHTKRLKELIRILPIHRRAVYLCVEAGSMNPIGWLTEEELIQSYLSSPDSTILEALTKYKILHTHK